MSSKSVLGRPTHALTTALLLSAGLWLANSLQAANLTWTGAVNSDWQTAGNWSPAQVPTASDTVNINYGTVTATAAAQFATLNFGGGTLSGTFTIASGKTMNWTAGYLGTGGALAVAVGGQLKLDTTGEKRIYGVLTNAGTVVWTGDAVLYYNRQLPARIVNLAGGVFEAQNDNAIAYDGTGGSGSLVFENYGTFRKRIGTGTTSFDGSIIFNNAGTLDVQSGMVQFNHGACFSSGLFNLATGASVYPAGGFTFTPSHQFRGPGTNLWLAATITADCVLNSNQFVLAGATLVGNSQLAGTLDWQSGYIGLAGTLTVAAGGQLKLDTTGDKRLYGVLTNVGTVVWTDYAVLYFNRQLPARIVNLAGGVFEAQNDSAIAYDGTGGSGSVVFDNYGTFRKRIGTGTTSLDGSIVFNNFGTLQVQSGTVQFSHGGSFSSGVFDLAAGASVYPAGGFTFASSQQFRGTGTNLWLAATITADCVLNSNQFVLAGATLAGNSQLAGTMDWQSGYIGTSGALTVVTNGLLTLSTTSSKRLYGVLTNAGTVVWTNNADLYYNRQLPARIVNLAGGVFEAHNDASIVNDGTGGSGSVVFDNHGTFRKRFGTGTTSLDGSVAFSNAGTLDVQSGVVQFNHGGSLSSGIFDLATGASVYPAGGFTFTPSHQFRGLGTNLWLAATITADCVLNSNQFLLAGATLAGSSRLAGTLDWQSGYIGTSGALTVATNGWLTLSTTKNKMLYGMLTNAGTVVWVDNANLYYNRQLPARIVNLAGGVFEAQNDNAIVNDGTGGSESVVFDNYGTFRKRIGTGTTSLDGAIAFNNFGTLQVQSGTVQFSHGGSFSSGVFDLATGASVYPAGGFTFTPSHQFRGLGTNLWLAATITADCVLNSNQFLLAGATLAGSSRLAGTLDWQWGYIGTSGALTVATNGWLTLSTTKNKMLYGMLTNAGTVVWVDNANLYYNRQLPARIVNLAGGVFEAQNDNAIVNDGTGGSGSVVFDNYGTFLKRFGTGKTSLDGSIAFNNVGTLRVLSGTVQFDHGGSSSSGVFDVAAGASVYPAGGFTFNPGQQFRGPGTNLWLAATITANCVLNSNQFVLAGATLSGSSQLAGTLDWQSGYIGVAGALTVAESGQLNLSTTGVKRLYGVLTNAGTVLWTGDATWYFGRQLPARIVNLAGGIFEAQNDNSIAYDATGGSGSVVFDNYGTFRKRIGTGTTSLDGSIAFNNVGTLDVQSGTVQFNHGGSSSSGLFDLAAGASVYPAGGFTFASSQQFRGTGTNLWLSATITADCVFNSNQFVLAGAMLAGNSQLAGTLDWRSGYVGAAGALTVAEGGQLNLSTTGDKRLYGVLTNAGTVLWTGDATWYFGRQLPARIVNLAGGIFEAMNDNALAYDGTGGSGSVVFDNYGTFRKRIGTGASSLDGPIAFNNTGTIEALSGTLAFNGGYTMTSGGVTFGFTSATDFGKVTVSGAVPLAGALGARLLGGYVPAVGAAFPVMTFGSYTGSFTDTNGLDVGSQRYFDPTYAATTLTLTSRFTNSVSIAPQITVQPKGVTNLVGTTATFTVTATGTAPLSYRWRKGGVPLANGGNLSGATSNAFTLANVQLADAGNYTVVVTNSAGSVTSAVAVLSVTNPAAVPLPAGCVAWWRAEGNANDSAGTNHGVFQSGAFYAPGKVSQAFDFQNTNYVLVNDSPSLRFGTGSLTIECWIQAPPESRGRTILGKFLSSYPYPTMELRLNSSGNLEFIVVDCGTASCGAGITLLPVVSPGRLDDGALHHIAGVRHATGYELFVDGQSVATRAEAAHDADSSAPLVIGGVVPGSAYYSFLGRIDELSIYNRSLTAGEIAAIYAAGSAGKVWQATAPAITAQPQSRTNLAGSTATFSVTATGTAPLRYQWRKGGVPLANGGNVSGAATNLLTLANVQLADAGNFTVVITNSAGSITSAVAVLTVTNAAVAPQITSQPQSRTNLAGTAAAFTVTATGTAPLSYQWRKDGVPLANGGGTSGATSNVLTLAGIQLTSAGNYTVVVTNAAGSVTSAVASLTVWVPPTIATQPQNRTNFTGTMANFSVTASGTAPLAYQWRFNGTNLPGATATNYTLFSAQLSNAGSYSVVITNLAGSVTSAVASLTVWAPPTIAAQPQSRTNLAGTTATFTVTAVGTPTPVFQWRRNGTNLLNAGNVSGVTTATLTLASVTTNDAASYTVVVTNLAGAITSTPPAVLAVWMPVMIAAQPQSQTVMQGSNVTFSVGATGTAPLSFQWLFNGVAMASKTNASLTLTGVQTNQAGDYRVQVNNPAGSTNSATATLAVQYFRDYVFANTNLIRIRDLSVALPYPSAIAIAGVPGEVAKVVVSLANFSHTWPSDVDVLLMSPGGQTTMLMSDAGQDVVSGETFTFDDSATEVLPQADWLLSGIYRPTSYSTNAMLPAPAPGGPYGRSLASHIGSSPNGSWSLFVRDDVLKDSGRIANGWTLSLRTLNTATGTQSIPLRLLPESLVKLPDGRHQVSLTGPPGQLVEMWGSSDLRAWALLGTVPNPTGSATFTDPATNVPVRFYRARTL